MKRYEERRDDLAKGIASLKAGLEEPATELAIDGVLHRFEFTFELAWKTIKDYLEYIGIVEKTGSLREAIKNSIWKLYNWGWRRMDRYDACKKSIITYIW